MSAVSARCAVKVGTDTVASARSDAGCETRDDKPAHVCLSSPFTLMQVVAYKIPSCCVNSSESTDVKPSENSGAVSPNKAGGAPPPTDECWVHFQMLPSFIYSKIICRK